MKYKVMLEMINPEDGSYNNRYIKTINLDVRAVSCDYVQINGKSVVIRRILHYDNYTALIVWVFML